jgi:hypothetical protein
LAKTLVFRNEHFQLVFKLKTTLLKIRTRARIYRSSFGHENDRFRENKPNTLVFNPIRTQRRRSELVLDEIRLVGSFQILELRRG